MAANGRRQRVRRRCALTLLEVILVLCLLVFIAAIAWPALERPLANQRVRKAADLVRAEWTRARVQAMASGRTYVFRYSPDSDQYRLEPTAGADDFAPEAFGLDSLSPDAISPAAPAASDAEGSANTLWSENRLPEGVRFLVSEVAPDRRAQVMMGQGQLPEDAGPLPTERDLPQAAALAPAEPILFYPDGTTSEARLTLVNREGRAIDLYLRGLTGVVTVGDLYTLEERLP